VSFDPKNFTAPKAKPLPVFLLLDVSGSMNEVIEGNFRSTGETIVDDGKTWNVVEGGITKMQILNEAVSKMFDSLAREEEMETEFLVSIITFGDQVERHLEPQPASSVKWKDMTAGGETAMGSAFSLVKTLIEDKDVVPSRAYRPAVVLVSDGEPTEEWENALEQLISQGRSSKCFFMAMGIGEDPGTQVLERFISQTPVLAEVNGTAVPNTVFHAKDSDNIHEFFLKVTMSVSTRRKSTNPNAVPESTKSSIDEGGYW
jgi:uncharacterized protein YegL